MYSQTHNDAHKTYEDPTLARALELLDAFPAQGVFPVHHLTNDGSCSCGKADCSSPGKHPQTPKGLHDAATDPEDVRALWARYPNSNVGMVTDGLLVLDVDMKANAEGKNGYDSLKDLLDGRPALPPTITSETGGDGTHYIFRAREGSGVRNKVGVLPGIDIRGTGGYIVAPGSTHVSGGVYEWAPDLSPREQEVATAPDWLVDVVTRGPRAPGGPAVGSPPPSGRDGAIDIRSIPEGQRNDTLFRLACRLRDGLQSETTARDIVELVNASNEAAPPLPACEVGKLVRSAYSGGPGTSTDASIADVLRDKYALFKSDDGSTYADVDVDGARRTYAIDSQSFAENVAYEGYKLGKRLSKNALADVVNQLGCVAKFEGDAREVYRRVAVVGDRMYVDLGDETSRAVEVRPDGWDVVAEPPVRFLRNRRTAALPAPERGGTLAELREHLNAPGDDEWVTLVAFMLSTFMPDGPYPILLLLGQQGSAKSTQARILMELTDPTRAGLMTPPRTEQDLFALASHGRLLSFDNLSGMTPALSDAFCRLSTGGAFGTRALYTNSDVSVMEAKRPVILNGIDDFGTRDDFLERCVLVNLPAIPPDRRRSEGDVRRSFESAKPRILGGLFDVLSEILRRLPHTVLEEKPRMSDFAKWVVAGEAALPWEPGTFMDVYGRSRRQLSASGLEGNAVAAALVALVESEGTWEGSATELLRALAPYSQGSAKLSKTWPQSARSMTNTLRRVSKALHTVYGVEVDMGEHMRTNTARLIRVSGAPSKG